MSRMTGVVDRGSDRSARHKRDATLAYRHTDQPTARQHTIAAPAVCAGVVVHDGRHVRMVLKPAPVDTGIVFVRTDVTDRNNRIAALTHNVVQSQLNTEIANAQGVGVFTIEHLMSALSALGIDNVTVELDGPECPIMDGSAAPFVQLLDRAGKKAQDAPRRFIEVLERIEVSAGDKMASLAPAPAFVMDFEIRYATPVIGAQRIAFEVTEDSFRREIAPARTFGFMHEVEQLRAMGLALGGSLENVVVIKDDAVLNPEGLRMEREFVRHKAMDAVGDLYTLGAPLLARFQTVRGGHALNNQLCRALLARPEAWRFVTFPPTEASQDLARAV
jgi:UDP-3-O-[3-hydroxymyristoyl] N-acetylglucosamine deacetylase